MLVRGGFLLGTTLVSSIALVSFRVSYFGQAFPQPVIAKVSGLDLPGGLEYFGSNVARVGPIFLAVLAVLGGMHVLRGNDPWDACSGRRRHQRRRPAAPAYERFDRVHVRDLLFVDGFTHVSTGSPPVLKSR